jgi:hypothetical protein
MDVDNLVQHVERCRLAVSKVLRPMIQAVGPTAADRAHLVKYVVELSLPNRPTPCESRSLPPGGIKVKRTCLDAHQSPQIAGKIEVGWNRATVAMV